ncbi:hypothetical protein [Mesorhizobium sp. A623]
MAADEIPAPDTYIEVGDVISSSFAFSLSPSIFEGFRMQLRFREPTLIELLNDPVMKADGVSKSDILELFDADQDTLADSPPAYICSGLLEKLCQANL